MASFIKIFVILTIIFGLSISVYWLWQRQPKNATPKEQPSTQTVVKNEESPQQQKSLLTKPEPGQILTTGKNTLSGKTKPKIRIILLGNQISEVLTTSEDGAFNADLSLPGGISLLQTIILDQNLADEQNQTLPLYAAKEAPTDSMYIAGTVTKIFSGTITVKTETKEIEIKTTKDTLYTNSKPAPSPSPKSTNKTQQEAESVRVGDYIAAIGQQKSGTIEFATKIEIYRENKPVISTKYVVAKIKSPAKSNIFSATNAKDSKLLEFTLDKNTQILEKEKKVTTASIAKDKTAIIFYQTEDKDNLVLKVHIL